MYSILYGSLECGNLQHQLYTPYGAEMVDIFKAQWPGIIMFEALWVALQAVVKRYIKFTIVVILAGNLFGLSESFLGFAYFCACKLNLVKLDPEHYLFFLQRDISLGSYKS